MAQKLNAKCLAIDAGWCNNELINAMHPASHQHQMRHNMTKTMTPKELAVELATDAKTLRKFLRSDDSGIADARPGKGGRWVIDANARSLKAIRAKFEAWDAARKATPVDEVEAEDATDEAPDAE